MSLLGEVGLPVPEKVPAALGRGLRGARAGESELAFNDEAVAGTPATIELTSPAFTDDGALPEVYTADGEGISPPLEWRGVPAHAAALVLLVEDADSPSPEPLVHAIAWDLPAGDGGLLEGAPPSAAHEGDGLAMGQNSYLSAKYLPPDPPTGHGAHRYAFEVFALGARPELGGTPGRGALLDALRAHAIAKGMLIGTHERC